MNVREAINTIKTYLNMEVKLAKMMLVDGVTVLEANEFVAGQEVYIVSDEEKIPLPIGEYELEDGKILVVSEDGIIGDIKDAAMEEEEAVEPEAETEVEATVETVESTPKKIIKLAKLADHDGVLHTSWGDLNYTAGNDYIVRHGTGDYGAVKKDIFAQTYDTGGINGIQR